MKKSELKQLIKEILAEIKSNEIFKIKESNVKVGDKTSGGGVVIEISNSGAYIVEVKRSDAISEFYIYPKSGPNEFGSAYDMTSSSIAARNILNKLDKDKSNEKKW